MIKLLQKYFRLKMKYEVEAERYQVLRTTPFAVISDKELHGPELDRAIDEYRIRVLRAQVEGLNKSLGETSGYDSGITYIKERAKCELKIVEIQERWQ